MLSRSRVKSVGGIGMGRFATAKPFPSPARRDTRRSVSENFGAKCGAAVAGDWLDSAEALDDLNQRGQLRRLWSRQPGIELPYTPL